MKRFWWKVTVGGPNECWAWVACIGDDGYGKFGIGRRTVRAHRFSYELHHGPIPEGLVVMHTCDNRACVNPAHLKAGTHAENSADMVRKGRGRGPGLKGEAHGCAKLSEKDVLLIRSRYASGGVSQKGLGAEFGVSQANISYIVRGLAWSR